MGLGAGVLANGREIWDALNHRGRVKALAFSPDGRHLATGGEDKLIKVWDLAAEQGRANGVPEKSP